MKKNSEKINFQQSTSSSDVDAQSNQKPTNTGFFSLRVQKWLQIFFVSLITLGPFINSYGISSVKEGFKQEFNLNDFEYNTMQSTMSFISCVCSFFCGLLTDKIGLRKSLLLFSFFCLIGYTVQFLGVYWTIFYLQCTGQCIGYVFLNALCVIQGPLISRWVDKKEYAVSLSITFLSVRLADVISSWTYPPIYENSGHLYLSFLFGTIMLFSTLIFGAVNSFFMDRKAEKRGYIQTVTVSDINFGHIKKLSLNYWLIVSVGVLGLSSFYSYYFNSQTILKKYYHIDGITAGRLFSIPFFVSFTSPVFGFILDRIKNKASFLLFSASSIVLGYLLWVIFYDCSGEECYKTVIPAYILLGLFLSTFTSTVWYCVFLTTSVEVSGTAYGMLVSSKNLGIALNGMMEGYILDQKSVFWAIMYPLIISILCLLMSVVVYLKNRKDQFLNISQKKDLDDDNAVNKQLLSENHKSQDNFIYEQKISTNQLDQQTNK